MTNRLTEQQLQEELLDEIGDFTKAITKKIGQGVGGIKGAGQKVKGAVTRAGQGLKQAYTQGRDSAQKTVAGQDYKASQPKAKAQAQTQAATTQTTTTKNPQAGVGAALKRFGKGVAGADSYNYRQGTQAQQDANAAGFKSVAQQASDKTTATTTTPAAGGGTQAQKRTKTGGKVAGQVSNTASAQAQRDRRAAKKQTPGQTATQVPGQKKPGAGGAVGATNAPKPKSGSGGSAVSKGIDQAQIDGANKGIANMQKKQTATKVPGQKAPAQVDANKDGKDDKTGKPISKTAQNVGKNAGVNTAKIGGQKVDLNDPKMKNLRNAIEKASPGTISAIDKMDAPSKAKLKKAIS